MSEPLQYRDCSGAYDLTLFGGLQKQARASISEVFALEKRAITLENFSTFETQIYLSIFGRIVVAKISKGKGHFLKGKWSLSA